jgi:hypothetical protein
MFGDLYGIKWYNMEKKCYLIVFKYFTIYRWYFFLKFEHCSWISYATLFEMFGDIYGIKWYNMEKKCYL